MNKLIFERGQSERSGATHCLKQQADLSAIPKSLLRKTGLGLPEVSELDVVRHYTALSQKNFSIDTQFYPLGSCTMKYNPRAVHKAASSEGFLTRHPLVAAEQSQGFMQCMYELQHYLTEITGMKAVSLGCGRCPG